MTWTNLHLNAQNIDAETAKAVLIVIPKSVCARLGVSEKMKFWHPAKLVRAAGGKGYFLTFALTEDFEIKAFRNGKGQYNSHEKIEEMTITGADLIESWEV